MGAGPAERGPWRPTVGGTGVFQICVHPSTENRNRWRVPAGTPRLPEPPNESKGDVECRSIELRALEEQHHCYTIEYGEKVAQFVMKESQKWMKIRKKIIRILRLMWQFGGLRVSTRWPVQVASCCESTRWIEDEEVQGQRAARTP
jgi:hypothetical protein